jgi:hypothetical protein
MACFETFEHFYQPRARDKGDTQRRYCCVGRPKGDVLKNIKETDPINERIQ